MPFPADAPPEAAEAARDTLGGAVGAADRLPDRVGAELLEAAREAFTQGLQLTAITSATIVIGMAILAAVLLRNVSPGSEPEGPSRSRPERSRAARAWVPPPRCRRSRAPRRKPMTHSAKNQQDDLVNARVGHSRTGRPETARRARSGGRMIILDPPSSALIAGTSSPLRRCLRGSVKLSERSWISRGSASSGAWLNSDSDPGL